jgi:hypothetical protein
MMRKRIGLWILCGLVLLIVIGLVARIIRASLVDPQIRFNLLYIDQQGERVSVLSYDPIEHKVLAISYPPELLIESRSVGAYEMRRLYTLGSYKDEGGEFARRKVQGFMRLPIVGYLVNLEGSGSVTESIQKALIAQSWDAKIRSNLTVFDRYRLGRAHSSYSEHVVTTQDLTRSGVLVGESFFDWGVGREGATVVVINESGLDLMGSDMASFLTNMGLDVIGVRSGSSVIETTKYLVAMPERFSLTLDFIDDVFDFPREVSSDLTEYRADIVFRVGKDALELF